LYEVQNLYNNYSDAKLSIGNYINKSRGSFYSFLIESRIVRNFQKGQAHRLLEETTNFIELSDKKEVYMPVNSSFFTKVIRKTLSKL